MKKSLLTKTTKFTLFFSLIILTGFNVKAQMITTYAGNGVWGNTALGPISPTTQFKFIDDLTMDATGNLYLGSEENKIFKITPAGIISVYAGNGGFTASGDGGPATSASIARPRNLVFDASGNLFFTASWNAGNHTIRMINTSGIISTIAGTGAMGFSGDGGLATAAELTFPGGLAFDSNGDLYFVDGQSGTRIRKIDMGTGIITTIAGNGNYNSSGNGGLAINAEITASSVTIDASDNIYFDNFYNSTIRKIDNTTGIINDFAGNGINGYSGDGGPALAATLGNITDMGFDASGNLYFTEGSNTSNPIYDNNTLRKIDLSGTITTVVGDGNAGYGFSGDGSSPTFCQMFEPSSFVFSNSGNEIYIADELNNRIRKVDMLATPICPNTFTVTKTHSANGEVLITPSINPSVGTPDFVGTINGNPLYNPLNTVNINTSTTHTEMFPGNGIYNLNLTYIDTISSMVCKRNIVDTI